MPLFAWDDNYSVSVPKFDDQHKVLFKLINDMHDAMLQGKGRDKVGDVLGSLLSYTRGHFTAEEAALRNAQYPDFASHKRQHDEFTAKVAAFESDYRSGNAQISVELMTFLRDWLIGHILKVDKHYATFLKP